MTESIKKALANLEKEFGKGIIRTFNDDPEPVEVIPTGSYNLDIALGVGGIPPGIIELYAPESVGKTSIALAIVAQAQKLDKKILYIDTEYALNIAYAKELGVDVNKNFHFSQPDNAEQALSIIEESCKDSIFDVIVVDSVAGLVPKVEDEGEIGASHMGVIARMMSQFCRKVIQYIIKSNTRLIMINQLRDKIGVFYGETTTTTTGGNALKYYASLRLSVRKLSSIKKNDVIVGHRIKVTVKKNKFAVPYKEAEFDLIYKQGIDNITEIIEIAEQKNVIERNGAWYKYNGQNVAQGIDKLKDYLKENNSIFEEIRSKI